MAFNFNWTPLAADASFYTRAQELLTAALNKSPKPPIIVDAILVTELNLGSVPPDLEILEIGDLAEDRFRGIFKMRYRGDAFLTLRTRVQANPLNTFLSTRPAFASPDPLAAASGLTIPLKITLSEIKLSAFIILVFSRQKGVTLVFRNDPLESLKVSSTFDSIPFVRDYLQTEIEAQLRTLLINEVPAIIHRLSLRLFVPEYRAREEDALARSADAGAAGPGEPVTDPLASPPRDPVDARGHALDPAQIAHLSLDAAPEAQSLFSRRNLLRLAALRNSNRTLSLFTPRLDDVVYRAATGPPERPAPSHRPLRPALRSVGSSTRRPASHASTPSATSFAAASDASSAAGPSRPPLSSFGTSYTSGTGGRAGRPGRRRKHRVVDLRKKPAADTAEDAASVSGASSVSGGWSGSAPTSAEYPSSAPEVREGEVVTPPSSPPAPPRSARASPKMPERRRPLAPDATPRPPARMGPFPGPEAGMTPRPPTSHPAPAARAESGANPLFEPGNAQPAPATEAIPSTPPRSATYASSLHVAHAESKEAQASSSASNPTLAAPFPYLESSPGGILEQAWMMRMAGEIARRVEEQKHAGGDSKRDFWSSAAAVGDGDEGPPPAYRA